MEQNRPEPENQQNLDRYYWELHRCLRQNPQQHYRILLRAMKQTDALRKKIKQLYEEQEKKVSG
ncbi:MAG: hypothetical protein AAF992_23805 [Bacteroidota bacterium]